MALGKHDVPIWDEAVSGMRVGGQRRMILPPSALPEFQADKVPGENRDLRFDFELLGSVDKATPLAVFASLVPPHRRPTRDSMFRAFATLWLLSFVPYFLPEAMQPEWYHDGKPMEVTCAHPLTLSPSYPSPSRPLALAPSHPRTLTPSHPRPHPHPPLVPLTLILTFNLTLTLTLTHAQVIRAEQEQRINSRFLGGGVADLNSLFP